MKRFRSRSKRQTLRPCERLRTDRAGRGTGFARLCCLYCTASHIRWVVIKILTFYVLASEKAAGSVWMGLGSLRCVQ